MLKNLRPFVSLGLAAIALTTACTSTSTQPALGPASHASAKPNCGDASTRLAISDVLTRAGLVEAVYEDHEAVPSGHSSAFHLRGAKIVLRPEPGMTRPLLGRAIECRIAMSSSQSPSNKDEDPLTTGHANFQLIETDTAFVLAIRSQNEEEAREILRRSNNLFAHSVARARANADTTTVTTR